MRIAFGCDHRGLGLKQVLIDLAVRLGHSCEDLGCYSRSTVDYPDIALKVGESVAKGEFGRGILICSTGIGMSIAANKVKGIRAARCSDTFSACRARLHNDANVLCLGEDVTGVELAKDITRVYLSTNFEGGRHVRRLDKIGQIESS